MARVHYCVTVGLAGGYMPNVCEVFRTKEEAVRYGAEVAEWRGAYTQLRKDEISYSPDWNEVATVVSCDCKEPWIHSENETEDSWG